VLKKSFANQSAVVRDGIEEQPEQEHTRREERSSRWLLGVPPLLGAQAPFARRPRRLQYPVDIHLLQAPPATSHHLMPWLGFPEQWFTPDEPLAQGLLVRCWGAICGCVVEIRLGKGTEAMAATRAVRAVRLYCARSTGRGIRSLDHHRFGRALSISGERRPGRATRQVTGLIIRQDLRGIEPGALAEIWGGELGTSAVLR
jgi:hypothetical protein